MMTPEHVEVKAVSGEVTCRCGWTTGHYAMMIDAWEAFDEHAGLRAEGAEDE